MYIILAEYNVPHPSLLRNKVTKSLKCTSSCCLVWLGSKSIILSSADVTAFYFCLKVRQFSCYHLRWLGKYIKGEIVVTVFNYKSECVCISSYASTLPLTQNVDTWSRPQSNLVEKYTHSWNCLFWQGYNVLLVNSKVAAGVFLIFSLRTSEYSFCTTKVLFLYSQSTLLVLPNYFSCISRVPSMYSWVLLQYSWCTSKVLFIYSQTFSQITLLQII